MEEYLAAFKNELIQHGHVIRNITINTEFTRIVAISISINTTTVSGTDRLEKLQNFFTKHRFVIWDMGNSYYVFIREISDILNELRKEGFKELLNG